jgi:cytoskeletal protein CcmA (bactofilin family)
VSRSPENGARLGPGTSFDGMLSFEGTLCVDGRLTGSVFADTGVLVIGAQGRVHARIEVAELVLAGVLVGDVIAHDRVELLPGGELEGSVTSPRLAVAEGGRVAGRWLTGAQALATLPKSA